MKNHLIRTGLYAVALTLSYFIMLIVMTMNVGLFVSAVLGLTLGHFFFAMPRKTEVDGNCC